MGHTGKSTGAKSETQCRPHCRLSDLAPGKRGRVVSVGGDTELRRRLLEMGFCNGAYVQVIRHAPLGDPIEFRLRGYHLSLRHQQAGHVMIEPE